MKDIRTGIGFDVHRLIHGGKLVIAGVSIPHDTGFEAHSDGDVLAHAISDALLGAAGLKDIGTFFPDTDPAFKNADSMKTILSPVVEKINALGWTISNIDCNLIMEKPKMAPFIARMKENLALVLRIETGRIGIKAKRTERCFLNPPDEAVIAEASVLLVK